MRTNLTCPACQAVLIVATDAPTDEPDAPVGEVPPLLRYIPCAECRSSFPGKVPGADGKLKRCPVCYGNLVVLAADVAA